MNSKHKKTLENIFKKPTLSGILWKDVESPFVILDADTSEGRGSRVRVSLGGIDAVFHRPHPAKETNKGAVESVRIFLENAWVKP